MIPRPGSWNSEDPFSRKRLLLLQLEVSHSAESTESREGVGKISPAGRRDREESVSGKEWVTSWLEIWSGEEFINRKPLVSLLTGRRTRRKICKTEGWGLWAGGRTSGRVEVVPPAESSTQRRIFGCWIVAFPLCQQDHQVSMRGEASVIRRLG